MRPPRPLAPNLKSLHLLRALLREVTYLPDAQARSYFHQYVVARFRAFQPSQNAGLLHKGRQNIGRAGFRRRPMSAISDRTREMQRAARKGLNYLRRANLGEKQCLEKVMFIAYGRMGRRKYALLDELLQPEEEDEGLEGLVDPQPEPAPLQALYHSTMRCLRFFDAPTKVSPTHVAISFSDRYPRLKAVVNSQVQHGEALGSRLKSNKLVTPINNVWERPMPVKRAANTVKKFYADVMSRLLPPLPNNEWDRLKALATGQDACTGAIRRRTPAVELNPQPVDVNARSLAAIEEGILLNTPNKADRPRGKERPHNLTPWRMQRLYGVVLRLCCKLEYNKERGTWLAIWGSSADKPPRISTTRVPATLFAGVDEKGKLVKDKEVRENTG